MLFRGDVYLTLLTFGNPLQPIVLSTAPPAIERANDSWD